MVMALTITSCGDGPDVSESKVPTLAPRVPTQKPIVPPPSSSVQSDLTMPHVSRCSNGPLILTGLALDPTIIDSEVTSFNLLGCFTNGEAFIQASTQLGYILSLAIAERSSVQPFKNIEELTKFSESYLEEFMKVTLGDSYLVLEDIRTNQRIRLFPIVKKPKGSVA